MLRKLNTTRYYV